MNTSRVKFFAFIFTCACQCTHELDARPSFEGSRGRRLCERLLSSALRAFASNASRSTAEDRLPSFLLSLPACARVHRAHMLTLPAARTAVVVAAIAPLQHETGAHTQLSGGNGRGKHTP